LAVLGLVVVRADAPGPDAARTDVGTAVLAAVGPVDRWW
jgi:hypothetical protein